MITNWQDPQTSEIRSTHISGLQEIAGKIEDILEVQLEAETGVTLTEVYISETDRYRIYQAPAGKRNWAASPAPVIYKNGVQITSGFTIDYGGGAIILSPVATSTDVFTADFSRVKTDGGNRLDMHLTDAINVKAFGASGSTQTTTGDITAESAALTLAAAIDFKDGQGITVNHAGAACTLATPDAPTVTPTGTAGTTAYEYQIVALDGNGGCTAASAAGATSTGNATLDATNYNALSWTAVTDAVAYAVYGRVSGTMQLLAIVSGTTWNDKGTAAITPPSTLPSTPPATALADTLVTTIVSGGGTTTLTLATTATTTATAQEVGHDDTAAIQAAAETAGEMGILYFPPGDYKISSPLTIPCNVDGKSAKIVCDTPLNPAIQIGTPDTYTMYKYIVLPQIIQTNKTWNGDVGVKCVNIYSCRVVLNKVNNFEVGLLVTASSSKGNVYNDYFIGHLDNNKVNLRIRPDDTSGWCNENNFYGGRYSHESSEGTNVTGIRHIEILPYDINNSSTSWPNNNIFYKPSVEGDIPEYHILIAGNYNTVIQGRYEALSPKIHLQGHATVTKVLYNMFIGGLKLQDVKFTRDGLVAYTQVITPSTTSMLGGGSVLNLENVSSSAYPLIQGFNAGTFSLNKNHLATDWRFRISANELLGKNSTDQEARLKIVFGTGQIYLGDGVNTPTKYLAPSSTGVKVFGGNLETDGGGYDTPHLLLGSYHIWVDSTGKLRIKNGAPTSDTDGVVVGTQT